MDCGCGPGVLDGTHTHVYGGGNDFTESNHLWDDFDNHANEYRDEVFAYPTVNSVVDTIQWEGFREGVDDIRYLTALRDKMNAGSAGCFDDSTKCTGTNMSKKMQAWNYLSQLKLRVLEGRVFENEMDNIRENLYQLTQYIN